MSNTAVPVPDDLKEMYEDAKIGEFYPSYDSSDVVFLIERIAQVEATVRELTIERDKALENEQSAWESAEAHEKKFEGCPHKPIYATGDHPACACSYDRIDHVCSLHAPALAEAQTKIAQLEAALQEKDEALKVAEEALLTCYESDLDGDHIQKQALKKIRAALAKEETIREMSLYEEEVDN